MELFVRIALIAIFSLNIVTVIYVAGRRPDTIGGHTTRHQEIHGAWIVSIALAFLMVFTAFYWPSNGFVAVLGQAYIILLLATSWFMFILNGVRRSRKIYSRLRAIVSTAASIAALGFLFFAW